jgi:hypothetical protein
MKLIIIIISIIILFYAFCYYLFPTEISILQTNVNEFNFNNLTKRQPIVISDFIQDPEKIIECWFKFNFKSKLETTASDDWIHNNYKYLFINAIEDTEVIIHNAKRTKENPSSDEKIIAIKLQKNQSLILPFKWKYYGNNLDIWGIDDIITASFGKFF